MSEHDADSTPPTPTSLQPSAELLATYHTACNEEGQPLEAFVEEMRALTPIEDLLALLNKIDADIGENIGLMASEHRDLGELAMARFKAQRERLRELRDRIQDEDEDEGQGYH